MIDYTEEVHNSSAGVVKITWTYSCVLHCRDEELLIYFTLILHGTIEYETSSNSSIDACVFVAAVTF
jgi:hypothetical protein